MTMWEEQEEEEEEEEHKNIEQANVKWQKLYWQTHKIKLFFGAAQIDENIVHTFT